MRRAAVSHVPPEAAGGTVPWHLCSGYATILVFPHFQFWASLAKWLALQIKYPVKRSHEGSLIATGVPQSYWGKRDQKKARSYKHSKTISKKSEKSNDGGLAAMKRCSTSMAASATATSVEATPQPREFLPTPRKFISPEVGSKMHAPTPGETPLCATAILNLAKTNLIKHLSGLILRKVSYTRVSQKAPCARFYRNVSRMSSELDKTLASIPVFE